MKNKNSKKSGPIRNARVKRRQTNFSAVTTIDTAPVAIGNSIRGSKPVITNSANGCRIVGRDFAFELKATVAAASNWSLIGGMPITPAVLATSSLRSYTQIFSKFKINRLIAHYITSSPTTQAGDVMFYYERERNGPMIDFTNNSFLPYVLSDPSTILGPQWNNHSMLVDPTKEWKSTDYGINSDLSEEAAGSIFLFSKTSTANSPGYVMIDFDITFKEMCVNPRAGNLPVTRGLWNYVTIGKTAVATTSGTTSFAPVIQGNNPDGTATAAPNGATVGDIYKVIFLVTNSTVSGTNSAWTVVSPATLLTENNNGLATSVSVDDGFTCYTVYTGGNNTQSFYNTIEQAKVFASNTSFFYGVTGTITFNLCTLWSLVGNNNSQIQSAY